MTGERERPASRPGGAAPPASLPLAQDFDAGSLYALRSAVAAHAAAAGLSRAQVYDVTAASHELAANAVRHGAGRGSLRLWAQDAYLYCAVADDGPARAGTGDGHAAGGDGAQAREAADPPRPVGHGHRLCLVGTVAD